MVYEVESVIEALHREADTSTGPDVRRFPNGQSVDCGNGTTHALRALRINRLGSEKEVNYLPSPV
jgi:hypothetical protein